MNILLIMCCPSRADASPTMTIVTTTGPSSSDADAGSDWQDEDGRHKQVESEL